MSNEFPPDDVVVRNAKLAVAVELKKKRALKQPIARFDPKTGEVFIEDGDGNKTVVGQAMTRGRYSERTK